MTSTTELAGHGLTKVFFADLKIIIVIILVIDFETINKYFLETLSQNNAAFALSADLLHINRILQAAVQAPLLTAMAQAGIILNH